MTAPGKSCRHSRHGGGSQFDPQQNSASWPTRTSTWYNLQYRLPSMERLARLVRARRRRARCRGARSRGREPRDRARPGLRPGPIRPARFSLAGHAKGASAKRSRRRQFPLISPRRATRLRLGVVPARLCQNAAAASRSRYPRTVGEAEVGAGLVACGGNAAIGSSGGRNISEHIGIPYKGGIRSGRRGLGRGRTAGLSRRHSSVARAR
jgi:hypothetical protein